MESWSYRESFICLILFETNKRQVKKKTNLTESIPISNMALEMNTHPVNFSFASFMRRAGKNCTIKTENAFKSYLDGK